LAELLLLFINRLPKYESRVGTWEATWSSYEWRITKFWAKRDGSVPHFSILVADGHNANDDQLLRSEVISATLSMMVWLKLRAKKGNRVCPVSAVSSVLCASPQVSRIYSVHAVRF
jgi:hypothetical protein